MVKGGVYTMVKNISIEEKLAKKLVGHLIQRELSTKEEKILVYGWSVLLINLLKITVVGMISALLGIFLETFVMLIAYTMLRTYAYGFHAKNSLNCTLISIGIFNLLPFLMIYGLNRIQISNQVFLLILYSVFLIDAILIYQYCPSPTQMKDRWKKADIMKKKFQALGMLICLALVCWFIPSQVYASMILLGVTMAVIFITPLLKY